MLMPTSFSRSSIPFVQSIHKVNNKQQDKHIEAQVWGEASDKTPVYAADVIVTYQVLPEKSAWLYGFPFSCIPACKEASYKINSV